MIDWKRYLLTKLKVAGFLFALIGWLMIFIFIFGLLYAERMSDLESFLQSGTFKWSIRLFVIALVIIMFKWKDALKELLDKNRWLRGTLATIYIGGAVGWVFMLVLFLMM